MQANRHQLGRTLFGGFVIVLGCLFLMDNLGWADVRTVLRYFWPVAFIAVGLLKILQTRTPQGVMVGGGLALVGVLFMLDRMGLISFGIKQMWPMLMIVVGLAVIFKPARSSKKEEGTGSLPVQSMQSLQPVQPTLMQTFQTPAEPAKTVKSVIASTEGSDQDRVDATVVLGGFQRSMQSQAFRGGEITVLMGGCELDLRQASFQGEAVLDLFAMWGGIEIKVPPDWTVILQGTPILGGFVEKTAIPADNAKRLVVRGYAIMGGVEITN